MKRFLSTLLILALLIAPLSALAAIHADGATLAVRESGFSVFVGWNNYPYRSDSVAPLVEMPVRSVLYGDMTRLVFTTVDEENQHSFPQGASILWQLSLTEEEATPRAVAWMIGDAVGLEDDAVIFYVDQGNANALMGYLPYQGFFQQAVAFPSPIEAIVEGVDGIYAFTESAVYLYHPGTGVANAIREYAPPSANAVEAYAAFETILDGSGKLSLRLKGQTGAIDIDTDVQAATAASGMVYYLRGSSSGAMLMAYNYGSGGSREIAEFGQAMYPQLVSDGASTVFAIGANREIYRYDALSGVTESFASVSASVELPVLCYSAPDLLIYDEGGASGAAEFVSAVELKSEAAVELPDAVIEGSPLISATEHPFIDWDSNPAEEPAAVATPRPAATAAPTPEPAYPDLSKGSRGDDVYELQEILRENGYPAGKPDGIFGSNTVNAVKLLQCDLDQKQNGVISHSALMWLRENPNSIPAYNPYKQLKSGDKNYRVAVMQSRLKALNWLGGKADGDYGKSTRTAVTNFQKEVGLKADGIAGTRTLKLLFADDAPKYVAPQKPAATKKPAATREPASSLPNGMDESVLVNMVRWMNNNLDPVDYGWDSFNKKRAVTALQYRLVQQGYMKKKQVTKKFDEKTWLAVKHYQNDNDLMPHPSGEPNKKTLESLFPSSIRQMVMY